MKSSVKRILSILVAIFLFIGSLFIYTSLIRPTYSEIKNLRAEVLGQLEFIDRNEVFIAQVQKILEQYQNISEIEQKLSLILPLEQNLAQTINQITGIIKINTLTIDSLASQQLAIRPSEQPELINGLGVIRFNINLSGAYENFKKFLQALETNVSLMDLVDLKIEPAGKSGVNNFSYLLTIDTYYQNK